MKDNIYLYVEDDIFSREALDLVLRRVLGSTDVYLFEDSSNFMQRVKNLPKKPNVILLDIHVMPHSGFDMLEMLREDDDFKDAHIIAVTASVMSEEVELLKESGFNGIIGKPIRVASIPMLISRVMQGEAVWHITGDV